MELKSDATTRLLIRSWADNEQSINYHSVTDLLDDLDSLLAEVERLKGESAEVRSMLEAAEQSCRAWRMDADDLSGRLREALTAALQPKENTDAT